MEQHLSNEPLLDLQVDYDSGNKFNEATRWAKFMAIICFIAIGFGVLALAISGAAIMPIFSQMIPGASVAGGLVMAVIIVVLIFFTFVTILLYRFATLVKQGVQNQDQAVFNEGLKNLKNYFLVNGILAILGILGNVISLFDKF